MMILDVPSYKVKQLPAAKGDGGRGEAFRYTGVMALKGLPHTYI